MTLAPFYSGLKPNANELKIFGSGALAPPNVAEAKATVPIRLYFFLNSFALD